MKTRTLTIIGRSSAVLALGGALALGGTAVASASPHAHQRGHADGNCSSARVSPFDYAGGGLGGVVTAVTTDSVTVQLWNGTTTTFAIDSSTTFTEGNASAPATDLVVGDRVQIKTSSSSSTTAASINIELAELIGTVSNVSGDTILITDPQGFTRTILVSGTTTYSEGGATASLTDVTSGEKIVAQGTVDANGTSLDALSIKIDVSYQNSHARGVVQSFTTDSVTVLEGNGTTVTFAYTTTTTFTEGKSTVTSAAVADGLDVNVSFTTAAPTTAVTVALSPVSESGTVTGVVGDTITLTSHHGATDTVVVSGTTTYTEGGAAASLSDVTSGVRVTAEGTLSGSTLDATSISIRPSRTTWDTTTTSDVGQFQPSNGFGFGFGDGGHHGHTSRGGRERH